MMPRTRKIKKITTKTKNRIRAIPPAAAEIPVKPKPPAISDMTKKIKAHFNIAAHSHSEHLQSGNARLSSMFQ